jgi:hypothetical protein|tara:strand:+ start:175 stop:327 length:153 start_codon:yes stop_codon:yes gene_type:complete
MTSNEQQNNTMTTQDTLAIILCLFVGFNLGVPQGVFGALVIAFVLWWQTR